MKKIFLMAAMAAAAVACNNMEQIQEPAENASFVASIAQTKTTLVDNVKTHWVADDVISVFGAEGANYWYGTTGSGETVVFDQTGTAEIEEGLVASMPYALYPYNYEAVIDGTTITTSIQKDQYAVVGNFPSNQKPLLVAQSDATGKLAFQHASSVIKFTLTDETIEWIYIKGNAEEKLTGTAIVSTDGSDTVIDGSWTETTATLKNEDGTPLAAGTYYLVMAPTDFASGITVEWGPTVEGYTNWKYTDKPVSAQMGHILNLGEIGYEENDTTPPTVEQTSAKEFSFEGENGTYTVMFNLSDNNALQKVRLQCWGDFGDFVHILKTGDDNGIWFEDMNGLSEYTLKYDITFTEAGTYKFWVTLYDQNGNSYDDETGYVTVSRVASADDVLPPVITLTSSGAAIQNEPYELKLLFEDETGIVKCWPRIVVHQNWANYAENTNADAGVYPTVEGKSYEFKLQTSFPTAGEYTVAVYPPTSEPTKIWDGKNAMSVSDDWTVALFNITVEAAAGVETDPPTVKMTSPTTATIGTTYTLTLEFSDESGFGASYPHIDVYKIDDWTRPKVFTDNYNGWWPSLTKGNTTETKSLDIDFTEAGDYAVTIWKDLFDINGNNAGELKQFATITVTEAAE